MTDQPAVSGVVVADNEKRLRQQISQTREELGDTVAQLAAKADVKRRVQLRSAALASRVKSRANKASMRRTATKGVSAARERPVPVAAAGAMAGLASLALLVWKRKGRKGTKKR